MKLSTLVISVFAALIMLGGSAFASSNPGLYVPVFDQNQITSGHLSLGEKYWTFEDKTGTDDDVDVSATMVGLGINWEHNVTYGFYHLRLGWVGLGDQEWKSDGGTFTSDIWRKWQDWGLYLGMGYIYSASIPMNPDDPNGFNLFWGLGFDINGLVAAASGSSGGINFDYTFYYAEIALVAAIGFNIPEIGLTAYALFTGNFLLAWEYRIKADGISAVYFSDYTDMSVVPFGVEIGICYTIPDVQGLRFGLSLGLINQVFINIHIGLSFRAPRRITN